MQTPLAHKKPRRFDRNLIVIGAGSGGLVSAYIAAAVGAKVTLIEKAEMGGDCLNRGCVPSKALIRSAHIANEIAHAKKLGLLDASATVDFKAVMERVSEVIKEIEPHDSVARYRSLGVEVIKGEATISSPWSVTVAEKTLTARNIIVATGARPRIPKIEGIEQIAYLTSDNLWALRELPKRLLVIGTGAIGCELAQAFAHLGSQVTMVGRGERIMPREDLDTSELMLKRFREDGIEVLLNQNTEQFIVEDNEKQILLSSRNDDNLSQNSPHKIAFDQVLIATGRIANSEGFGLEALGVEVGKRGRVEANQYLQSHCPSIYLCGDVVGKYQFTHAASNHAWYATINSLFGFVKRFKLDESILPFVTFTTPEVAQVGLNESRAKAQNINYEMTQFPFSELDRAITEDEKAGWIKVLTVPGKDKILGVTIVGARAGELLQEYVIATRHNLGLNKILGTIHPYPTFVEINQRVAGAWKRNHAPQWALQLAKKIHAWRR